MVNKTITIGRLSADPEVRYTQGGSQVTTFSIPTSERWKGQDGHKEETEWNRIVAFGKLAEICGEYLCKGSMVYIGGKLKTRKWQDSNGVDRYSTEIIAQEMKMLGGERKEHSGNAGGGQATDGDMGDDVPF